MTIKGRPPVFRGNIVGGLGKVQGGYVGPTGTLGTPPTGNGNGGGNANGGSKSKKS